MPEFIVVLGIVLVAVTGEKHSQTIEMPSIEECWEQAEWRMELMRAQFPHRDEYRIGIGCWLVRATKEAKAKKLHVR